MGIELARLQGAFAAYQKQLGVRTQSDLGAEIHVQQSTVSNWLRGARSVPAEKVPELAKALGCSTDYLFGLTDQPAPDPNARGAGEYTGLSPAAISALHDMETAPFIADYTKMALEGFSMPDSAADVKRPSRGCCAWMKCSGRLHLLSHVKRPGGWPLPRRTGNSRSSGARPNLKQSICVSELLMQSHTVSTIF